MKFFGLFPLLLFTVFLNETNAQWDSLTHEVQKFDQDSAKVNFILDQGADIWGGDMVSKNSFLKIGLKLSRELGESSYEARSLLLLGTSHRMMDSYDSAMSYLLGALDIYEDLGDISGKAQVNRGIGIVYDLLGQTEKAREFVLVAKQLYMSIGDFRSISNLDFTLGVIAYNLGDLDSSIYYFEKVAVYREEVGDVDRLAPIYNNLGGIQMEFKRYEDGFQTLKKARKYANQQHGFIMPQIYGGLARAHTWLDNHELVLVYADSAFKAAKVNKSKFDEQVICNVVAEFYVLTGNFDSAVHYYTKQADLEYDLRSEEVQTQVEELNIQYETEKKENQILRLEQERVEIRFRNSIIAIVIAALIVIAILIIIVLRYRVRVAKSKQKELQLDLDHKNRELASYTVNFVQKNELISNIREEVNQLKKSIPESAQEVKRINKIIDDTSRVDNEWEDFKFRFEEVHEGFFKTLNQQFPGLGNAEIKLCALLRLNMNLKESAQILGISSDSVKTARYRIRKKMNLSTEDNLVQYITSIT